MSRWIRRVWRWAERVYRAVLCRPPRRRPESAPDPLWPRPAQIWDYYDASVEALEVAHEATVRGAVVSSQTGLPRAQVDAHYHELRQELDRHVGLLLVAGLEARLMTDFLVRTAGGGVPPSKGFRRARRHYGDRVGLRRLLELWRPHASSVAPFRRTEKLFEHRNWLAHGRWWVKRSGLLWDPDEMWKQAERLLDELPGVPDVHSLK